MPDHLAALKVDPARLVDRDHDERGVGDDRQEGGIDGAKVAIVAAAHHADVRVAALLARGQPVHVPELGRAYAAEP